VKTINGSKGGGDMVSRRKILSRSRDDLSSDVFVQHQEEEDVWYQKEKLFRVSSMHRAGGGGIANEFSLRNQNKNRSRSSYGEISKRKTRN
jgi:hypothetical protein